MTRHGIVWIAENPDPRDPWLLTGRFSAHWEADDLAAGPESGPDDLTADEAIACGRERAAEVLIRLGDSGYFLAGEDNADGYPIWPPPG